MLRLLISISPLSEEKSKTDLTHTAPVLILRPHSFLYVLMPNVTSIEVMSLDGPGQATSVQTLELMAPAGMQNLTLSAQNLQGMTVYVAPQ